MNNFLCLYFQLKTKCSKLKTKVEKLENLNADLQQQLLCAKQFLQMPSGKQSLSNQDVLKVLKKRIVPKLSKDEVSTKVRSFVIFSS